MSHAKNSQVEDYLPYLCNYCRNIFENWPKTGAQTDLYYPHYQNPIELEDSANNGCSLCTQFIQGGLMVDFQDIKDKVEGLGKEYYASRGVKIDYEHRRTRRNAKKPTPAPKLKGLSMTFRLRTNMDGEGENPWSELRVSVEMVPAAKHKILDVTHTRDSLGLASQWLKSCCESHNQCSHREDFTPNRLVSTNEGDIRLFFAEELPKFPSYATLSHCWGTSHFFCLKTGNLETFKNAIPSTALSQTFRDSIDIARELGFPYIWIDSLCIVQDDPNDWECEAALMTSVYGNSGLNIAAARGSDGNAGCFVQRPSSWRCKTQIQTETTVIHYDCIPCGWYTKSLADMPLLERGWVLQERLLAARTLYFTSTELFWECYEQTASEIFPKGLPVSVTEVSGYFSKEPVSRDMWDWIVAHYSAMNLTYEKDKLIAIAGLAGRIQSQASDQYVAGMWRKGLETQLCWQLGAFNFDGGRRPEQYRAPSWSWASLKDGIYPASEQDVDRKLWIHIQDVHLQFAGPDLLSQISMATLSVECSCLIHVHFRRKDSIDILMVFEGGTVFISLSLDCFPDVDAYNRSISRRPDQTFALPVFGSSLVQKDRVTGLILEPAEHGEGNYRRIGMFYTSKADSSQVLEKAASSPLCRAKDNEVVQTWKDPKGKSRTIINLV